jgi:putative PIN family toxin of toxin-antitoxin system
VKVVLDTNVVISRTFSPDGAPATIISRWLQGTFELLISMAILDEYRQALTYPRIQQRIRIGVEAVEQMLADFERVATSIEPGRLSVGVSFDPDDDKFLECALSGNADYLVTGDQHLLALGTFRGIPVVTPAAFLVMLDDPDLA